MPERCTTGWQESGRRTSDAGLTLVEVLIVLVLVAVLGGMAALSVGRLQAGPGLERRAETLAVRLTIAAETAAMTGRDAALVWTAEGYRFLTLRDEAWVPHDVRELGEVERLDGLALSGAGAEAGNLLIRADLTPPDAAPIRLALRQGAAEAGVLFDGLAARVADEGSTQ